MPKRSETVIRIWIDLGMVQRKTTKSQTMADNIYTENQRLGITIPNQEAGVTRKEIHFLLH